VSVVRATGPPVWTAIFAWTVSPAAAAIGWPMDFAFTWYCQAFMALATLAWTYRLPAWIVAKRVPGAGGEHGAAHAAK
jgi:hypothetical protein